MAKVLLLFWRLIIYETRVKNISTNSCGTSMTTIIIILMIIMTTIIKCNN